MAGVCNDGVRGGSGLLDGESRALANEPGLCMVEDDLLRQWMIRKLEFQCRRSMVNDGKSQGDDGSRFQRVTNTWPKMIKIRSFWKTTSS